ncbi:hypothetical protein FB451DRAFT_1162525 [Mycena latifolia]|nr:hypothetical protein FB451DRAFT_1162525 [Mycena latifolia]
MASRSPRAPVHCDVPRLAARVLALKEIRQKRAAELFIARFARADHCVETLPGTGWFTAGAKRRARVVEYLATFSRPEREGGEHRECAHVGGGTDTASNLIDSASVNLTGVAVGRDSLNCSPQESQEGHHYITAKPAWPNVPLVRATNEARLIYVAQIPLVKRRYFVKTSTTLTNIEFTARDA